MELRLGFGLKLFLRIHRTVESEEGITAQCMRESDFRVQMQRLGKWRERLAVGSSGICDRAFRTKRACIERVKINRALHCGSRFLCPPGLRSVKCVQQGNVGIA